VPHLSGAISLLMTFRINVINILYSRFIMNKPPTIEVNPKHIPIIIQTTIVFRLIRIAAAY